MILASEAAQKSVEAIQNHETEELKHIDKAINKACSNGLRSIYLDTMISVEARKELERVRTERIEQIKQSNTDYTKLEQDLRKNIRASKAGRL